VSKRGEWRAITRSKLESLYKKHSGPAIAAMYDVTTGAVMYRLSFFSLRSRDSGIKHSPGPKRSFLPPKGELADLYGRMSMRDVAAHYGVGETIVFHRLRHYGIPVRTRAESLSGRPKTLSHRLALSRGKVGLQIGEANPNWRGGASSKTRLARSKAAYLDWKYAVLKAANHRCQSCGIEHGKLCKHCGHRIYLHAHHIVPFCKDEKLRYEPSNGKALCERCHDQEHDKQIG